MKSFGSILTTLALTSIAFVSAGTVSRATDINYASLDGSVVNDFAVMQDLEPLPVPATPATRPVPTTSATYTFTTEARSSTPDVDRSKSYAAADPFASTRAVLPLLVLDVNPNKSSGVRPMTGRSVGARPSLPLARPESR
jgi:hypothetical protein